MAHTPSRPQEGPCKYTEHVGGGGRKVRACSPDSLYFLCKVGGEVSFPGWGPEGSGGGLEGTVGDGRRAGRDVRRDGWSSLRPFLGHLLTQLVGGDGNLWTRLQSCKAFWVQCNRGAKWGGIGSDGQRAG